MGVKVAAFSGGVALKVGVVLGAAVSSSFASVETTATSVSSSSVAASLGSTVSVGAQPKGIDPQNGDR